MDGRIDYVRLRLTGDQYTRKADTAEWHDRAAAIVERHNLKGKPYDEFMLFDHVTNTWSTLFNIWGYAAEVFYRELEVHHFSKVMRLDYRVPLMNDSLDIEAVALYAIANAKSKGLSYDFHGGRVKTKRNGRDTGGPSLSCGAKDSSRRIALYKRGHENPGVEAQISSKLVKDIIHDAYHVSTIDGGNFHDILREKMRLECDNLCKSRLLHPLEAFTGDGAYFAQSDMRSAQEVALEQSSLLWELLDEDTRYLFVQRHIDPDVATNGFFLPAKTQEPETPPDDYYEGATYTPEGDELDNRAYDDYSQGNW